MEIANVDMAAAWDGPEGEHWSEHADRYERAARRHWARFVEAVPIGAEEHVLDVGCGTGSSTRHVGRIVTGGSVLGVDLSSQMLEVARRRAEAEGLVNVRFEQADAQVHPFEADVFDLVVSRFGIMFFADPIAAFANIARSLRPGARLAVLAWRGLTHNEWLSALLGALAMGRELPMPPAAAPGPLGLADADHVRRVLVAAGLAGVALDEVTEPLEAGDHADDAFDFVSSLGATRGLIEDLDEATRREALQRLRRVIVDHETDAGVLLGSSAWLITATKR